MYKFDAMTARCVAVAANDTRDRVLSADRVLEDRNGAVFEKTCLQLLTVSWRHCWRAETTAEVAFWLKLVSRSRFSDSWVSTGHDPRPVCSDTAFNAMRRAMACLDDDVYLVLSFDVREKLADMSFVIRENGLLCLAEKIIGNVVAQQSRCVMVVRNQPTGSLPTRSDLTLMNDLLSGLNAIDVGFSDYIVTSREAVFSAARAGLL